MHMNPWPTWTHRTDSMDACGLRSWQLCHGLVVGQHPAPALSQVCFRDACKGRCQSPLALSVLLQPVPSCNQSSLAPMRHARGGSPRVDVPASLTMSIWMSKCSHASWTAHVARRAWSNWKQAAS